MTDSDVKDMVVRAWKNAPKNTDSADNRDKEVHKERSAGWVDALAKELKYLYEKDDRNIRVLWKQRPREDEALGSWGELLFDIAVCQFAKTTSYGKSQTLYYVNECLWQVESELGGSGEIMRDLSKLVIGSSKMKLFVAKEPRKQEQWEEGQGDVLEMCKKAAVRCGEPFYFCFIPHPSKWKKVPNEYKPSVWVLRNREWQPISQ